MTQRRWTNAGWRFRVAEEALRVCLTQTLNAEVLLFTADRTVVSRHDSITG